MDLSSHLENQPSFDKLEEDYGLNEESHDLPTLPEARKKSNISGVGINTCMGCVFFLSFCSAIISMATLLAVNINVQNIMEHLYNTSGCILSGTYKADVYPPLHFKDSPICNFAVFGMTGLAGLSMLYMCGHCCRCVLSGLCGTSAFNFFAVIDFITVTLSTLVALSIGIIINFGRKDTCAVVLDTYPEGVRGDVKNCSTDLIYKDGKSYNFDQYVQVAEMSAWTTAIILALLAIGNMILLFGFSLKCYYKLKARRGPKDSELASFDRQFDDDDDPLLDPSKDPSAPKLEFNGGNTEHSSFPPYNTGGDDMWNGTT